MSATFFERFAKLNEAMIAMPLKAAGRLLDPDGERGFQQAGWKAYDAWVRLVNATTDEIYASPAFGASIGRTMEAALKWQRLGSAITGAFFAALWPAVGLPAAAELTELRAEMRALRDEVAAARLDAEEARAAETALRPSAEHPANDALAAMWNGWIREAPFVSAEASKDAPAN